MNLANVVLDSPVFQQTPREQIPADADAKNAEELRKQHRQIQNLKKLAYALGVGKMIRANRKASGENRAGEYFYSREFNHQQRFLSEWNLSPKQLSTIHREVRNGRDVIVLDHDVADDPASVLAHEIGHHINHRLGGLSPFERNSSRVTANMRRIARLDDYFWNRDEFYAEAWSLFLCGENRPTLYRYLSRPLRRLRVRHPEKARLIETYASWNCSEAI